MFPRQLKAPTAPPWALTPLLTPRGTTVCVLCLSRPSSLCGLTACVCARTQGAVWGCLSRIFVKMTSLCVVSLCLDFNVDFNVDINSTLILDMLVEMHVPMAHHLAEARPVTLGYMTLCVSLLLSGEKVLFPDLFSSDVCLLVTTDILAYTS